MVLTNLNQGHTRQYTLHAIEQRMEECWGVGTPIPVHVGAELHLKLLQAIIRSRTLPHDYPVIMRILQQSADGFSDQDDKYVLAQVAAKWNFLGLAEELPMERVMQLMAPHLQYTAGVRTGRIAHTADTQLQLLAPQTVVQLMAAQSKPPNPAYFTQCGEALTGQLDNLPPDALLAILKAMGHVGSCPPGLSVNDLLHRLVPHRTDMWYQVIPAVAELSSSPSQAEQSYDGIQPFVKEVFAGPLAPRRLMWAVVRIAGMSQPIGTLMPDDEDAYAFAKAALEVLPKLSNVRVILVANMLGTMRGLGEHFDTTPLLQRLTTIGMETQNPNHALAVIKRISRILVCAQGPLVEDMDTHYQAFWR